LGKESIYGQAAMVLAGEAEDIFGMRFFFWIDSAAV
jgi:hypothetical protein